MADHPGRGCLAGFPGADLAPGRQRRPGSTNLRPRPRRGRPKDGPVPRRRAAAGPRGPFPSPDNPALCGHLTARRAVDGPCSAAEPGMPATTSLPPRSALPRDIEIPVLPELGRTWYARGGKYWVRRAALAFTWAVT